MSDEIMHDTRLANSVDAAVITRARLMTIFDVEHTSPFLPES